MLPPRSQNLRFGHSGGSAERISILIRSSLSLSNCIASCHACSFIKLTQALKGSKVSASGAAMLRGGDRVLRHGGTKSSLGQERIAAINRAVESQAWLELKAARTDAPQLADSWHLVVQFQAQYENVSLPQSFLEAVRLSPVREHLEARSAANRNNEIALVLSSGTVVGKTHRDDGTGAHMLLHGQKTWCVANPNSVLGNGSGVVFPELDGPNSMRSDFVDRLD